MSSDDVQVGICMSLGCICSEGTLCSEAWETAALFHWNGFPEDLDAQEVGGADEAPKRLGV